MVGKFFLSPPSPWRNEGGSVLRQLVGAVVPAVKTLDIADEDKGDKRQIVNVSLFFFGGWGEGGRLLKTKL